MKICDDGHEEVVYSDYAKVCPVCDAIAERDDAIQQLEQSEKEIVRLEGKIELMELERGGALED